MNTCYVYVIVCLFSIVCGKYTGPLKKTPKTIGSRATDITEIPYHVQVEVQDFGFICSGAIIGQQWVITAAQCIFDNSTPSQYTIRAGSFQFERNGTLYNVSEIIMHELWDPVTMQNDLTLLKTETPFVYSGSVNEIELAWFEVGKNEIVKISGWGWKSINGSFTDHLQSAITLIVNHSKCQEIYEGLDYNITASQVCAGLDETIDICTGDSGGPLVAHHHLIGVTSGGIGCAGQDAPGFYSSVTHFFFWIFDKIQ